jgi:hypothetical protein
MPPIMPPYNFPILCPALTMRCDRCNCGLVAVHGGGLFCGDCDLTFYR